MEATEKVIPKEKRKTRKKWMTEEILEMMEERRLLKGNSERYRAKDREIKRKCKERKDEWLKECCKEVEALEKTNSKQMHEKIRELTGDKRPTKNIAIKDEQGNVVMDPEEVIEIWGKYVKHLYNDR